MCLAWPYKTNSPTGRSGRVEKGRLKLLLPVFKKYACSDYNKLFRSRKYDCFVFFSLRAKMRTLFRRKRSCLRPKRLGKAGITMRLYDHRLEKSIGKEWGQPSVTAANWVQWSSWARRREMWFFCVCTVMLRRRRSADIRGLHAAVVGKGFHTRFPWALAPRLIWENFSTSNTW